MLSFLQTFHFSFAQKLQYPSPEQTTQAEQTKTSSFSLTQGRKKKRENSDRYTDFVFKGCFLASSSVSRRREVGYGKTLIACIKMQQESLPCQQTANICTAELCERYFTCRCHAPRNREHMQCKAVVFSSGALEAHLSGLLACLTRGMLQ